MPHSQENLDQLISRPVIDEGTPSEEKRLKRKCINFLLIGTAGSGKSETGNSILGRSIFQTSTAFINISTQISKESSKFQGYILTVVDIPGETDDIKNDAVSLSFQKTISHALELCPDGFSAFVYVLKYGNRFTRQETHLLKLLKSTMGEAVIKDSVICVLTHGDMLEQDLNLDVVDFVSWCRQQTGEIRKLFEECNFRCTYFNNKTQDSSAKENQILKLVSLANDTMLYKKRNYIVSEGGREKLTFQNLSITIMQETNEFLQRKRTQYSKLLLMKNTNKKIDELKILLNELVEYEKDVLKSKCHFPKTCSPTNLIYDLKSQIDSRIKLIEFKKVSRDTDCYKKDIACIAPSRQIDNLNERQKEDNLEEEKISEDENKAFSEQENQPASKERANDSEISAPCISTNNKIRQQLVSYESERSDGAFKDTLSAERKSMQWIRKKDETKENERYFNKEKSSPKKSNSFSSITQHRKNTGRDGIKSLNMIEVYVKPPNLQDKVKEANNEQNEGKQQQDPKNCSIL